MFDFRGQKSRRAKQTVVCGGRTKDTDNFLRRQLTVLLDWESVDKGVHYKNEEKEEEETQLNVTAGRLNR